MKQRKTRLFHTIVVVGAALTSPLVHAEKRVPPEAKAPVKKTTKKKKPKAPVPPPRQPQIEPAPQAKGKPAPEPAAAPTMAIPIEPGPPDRTLIQPGKPLKPGKP